MKILKVSPQILMNLFKESIQDFTHNQTSITLNLKSLITLPPPDKKDRPTIKFTAKAYDKMDALVQGIDKEIAWHGLVTKKNNTYTITDIIVYPQIVTGTTVTSNDDLYPLWLDELDDDTFNSIRMQGHSHVRMGVTPSSTDEAYYTTLTKHITDYYIFIIMNKSGKIWTNIFDIENNVVYENADIDLKLPYPDYADWAEDQIDEFIYELLYNHKSKSPSYTNYHYLKGRGY